MAKSWGYVSVIAAQLFWKEYESQNCEGNAREASDSEPVKPTTTYGQMAALNTRAAIQLSWENFYFRDTNTYLRGNRFRIFCRPVAEKVRRVLDTLG